MTTLKKQILKDIERNVDKEKLGCNTLSAFMTHSFKFICAALMLDLKINLFNDKLFICPEKKITFSFFNLLLKLT